MSVGKVIGKREPGMRGAVAAGHPLTAEAGARVLEEGGNAVDACVAAAFASWVAESPLTGPGAGGFALVHSADGRPERLADFFVATPGARPGPAGRRSSAGRHARDRRRVRRRCAGDAGLSDRRALVRRPGSGGRARGAPPCVRRAAVGRAARTGRRACPRRSRAHPAPGPPARDSRPDPAPHRRGAPALQRGGGVTAGRRRRPPAAGSRRHARADRRCTALRRSIAASSPRRSRAPSATAAAI